MTRIDLTGLISNREEEVMEVPQGFTGKIIGKGGAKIREIKEASNAFIKV